MEPSEAIQYMLQARETTQKELAEKMGLKSQGSISSLIGRNNLTVAKLIKMANSLEFEVVLRGRGAEDVVLGEAILDDRPVEKSELDRKIDGIADMLRELVEARRDEKTKSKQPSRGKIPLTAGTAADGQYYDPEWYMQEKLL